MNNYRVVELNYNQFLKKFKDYRQNPTADLVDRIPDQRDANGKLRESAEVIRELNTEALERLAKDNNLIEINFLK